MGYKSAQGPSPPLSLCLYKTSRCSAYCVVNVSFFKTHFRGHDGNRPCPRPSLRVSMDDHARGRDRGVHSASSLGVHLV